MALNLHFFDPTMVEDFETGDIQEETRLADTAKLKYGSGNPLSKRFTPGQFNVPNRFVNTVRRGTGASGRHKYSEEALGRAMYEFSPMDRTKLDKVMKREGNWVNMYQDLISRYSIDKINAFMNGGEAHYGTQIGVPNGFYRRDHLKAREGMIHRPIGTNGNHALRFTLNSYAFNPDIQGAKFHGNANKRIAAMKAPTKNTIREVRSDGYSMFENDMVPFVRFN